VMLFSMETNDEKHSVLTRSLGGAPLLGVGLKATVRILA
jgi:hypothetical protein